MDRSEYRDPRADINIGIHGPVRNIGIDGPVKNIGILGPANGMVAPELFFCVSRKFRLHILTNPIWVSTNSIMNFPTMWVLTAGKNLTSR